MKKTIEMVSLRIEVIPNPKENGSSLPVGKEIVSMAVVAVVATAKITFFGNGPFVY